MQQLFRDCHMHSSFSSDSSTPMEEMILRAARLGLPGICFTEHLDPDYPKIPEGLDFSLDIPAYREELYRLRQKYQDQIWIGYGIELGLQPHLADRFVSLVKEESFDFVIGSSHLVDGSDPYYQDYFEGKTEKQAYGRYFESELENVQTFHDFDVYGHLDYILRYGPAKNRNFRYEDYADILEELLKALIRCGIGLELNTKGYHYDLGGPNPSRAILTRYRELGGEIITIGADAHAPEWIACSFDQAKEDLLSCGFRYFTVFENRKPRFCPIED